MGFPQGFLTKILLFLGFHYAERGAKNMGLFLGTSPRVQQAYIKCKNVLSVAWQNLMSHAIQKIFGPNIFSMQLFTLIRSYVQMCKRCITPSYDSLFAQKLESHITHVFVYSLQLQEIAFKKFSLQSRFIRLGSYFCQLSIL